MSQDQSSNDAATSNVSSSDQNEPNTTTVLKKKSNKIKYIIFIIIVIILALIAFGIWKSYTPAEIEVQGRVETETIYVSTKVPSRVEEMFVEEGQSVKKGQALIRLHSPLVENQKKQALAALQTAIALQSTVYRGLREENIETIYVNWQALKAQAVLASTTYEHGKVLYKEGVISRQRYDQMRAAAASTADLAEGGYQQYLRAKRGSTTEDKSAADAQVDIAQAAVAEANALEAETLLRAPIDAIVSKTFANPSELILPNVPLISLLNPKKLWVSLNIREDHYQYVYKKKELEGFIPALNQSAKFRIQEISPQGDFATIKTTRQTGGYDIRSFKFHLVPAEKLPNLKMGMSVIFKISEDTP